jgi:transcriptional regulator with XRE-family HTH domain
MSNFGKEVKKAIIDKDIKLKDLAKEIGISAPYMSDILKGNRIATKYKAKIAEYLGLDYISKK